MSRLWTAIAATIFVLQRPVKACIGPLDMPDWMTKSKIFENYFFPDFFLLEQLLFFTPQHPLGILEFCHWNIHPTAWSVKLSLGHFWTISALKKKKLAKKSYFGRKMALKKPNFAQNGQKMVKMSKFQVKKKSGKKDFFEIFFSSFNRAWKNLLCRLLPQSVGQKLWRLRPFKRGEDFRGAFF